MTVEHVWSGAVTDTSAWVRARTPGAAAVRLHVSTEPDLSDPVIFPEDSSEVPDADAMVSFRPELLDPSTVYNYGLEVDSVVDLTATGTFRTHPVPGQPASFTFVAASCAGEAGGGGDDSFITDSVSDHPVFDRIGGFGPLFVAHLGDANYRNLANTSSDIAEFRSAYDDMLTFNGVEGLTARQGVLFRQVPLVYTPDNHDGMVDSTRLGRDAFLLAYRERVPHYPLPAGTGANPVYQSWQVGRVLFVMTDTRSARSPVTDPDGPGKTVLGAQQKAWFRGLLESSGAAVLVWLQTQAWPLVVGTAGWNVYQHERDELAAMFTDLGWAGRMCTVYGDIHALGIDSGANNPFGGFPSFQVAPMDAAPGGARDWYDIGYGSGGRDQFMAFNVADVDDVVTITGQAIRAGGVLFEHSFTVDTSPPDPTPEPGPPTIATAKIRRRLTWYGINAVTGRIVAELPDVRGEVSRLLSAYQSASLTMPIPLEGSPGHVPIPLVEQATATRDAALVAVVNDLPTWMGWVLDRDGGTEADLKLACVTPEGYLLRRRVRTHVFTQVDRADIAAALVGDAEDIAGVGAGFGFTLDVTPTGDLIDRTYLFSDRQFIYDALRELAADGLEFTVDLDWVDNTKTTVRKIFRIGPRIGTTTGAVLFEATASSMFESQAGSEATYRLRESYATGKGANHVTAVASGEGEDQPASAPAIDLAALAGGSPIVEHVLELSSAATDQGSLDRAAHAELARLRNGAQVWEIAARLDAYPRPGIDAQIGDDVSWSLTGHRHPTGVLGTGRMIGYVIDQQAGRWRPILLEPGEEVVS